MGACARARVCVCVCVDVWTPPLPHASLAGIPGIGVYVCVCINGHPDTTVTSHIIGGIRQMRVRVRVCVCVPMSACISTPLLTQE